MRRRPNWRAPVLGRLGQTIEGGGKRRAVGHYLYRRLLRPVHEWLMEVLRRLPMDGTFMRTQPLDRLVGEQTCFSFDLKSATDRWPLVLMTEVVEVSFGKLFAASSVNPLLGDNAFEVCERFTLIR